MSPEVRLVVVPARPTLVVRAVTTWPDFPGVWRELSGEVWAHLRAAGVTSGCPNVMLYRDDVPDVEVGVVVDAPPAPSGRVVVSHLPAGTAAVALHQGPFGDVGATHEAVLAWCRAEGLRPSRMRWEVYGPHREDPGRQEVEVGWYVER